MSNIILWQDRYLEPGREHTGAEIGHACDQLVSHMQGSITHFEQRRASHLPLGIPDREYRIFRQTIAFEIKSPKDKLTRAQYDLLESKKLSGQIASCGGLDELIHLLPVVRGRALRDAQELGWLFVKLWAARGFRPQRGR